MVGMRRINVDVKPCRRHVKTVAGHTNCDEARLYSTAEQNTALNLMHLVLGALRTAGLLTF